MSRAASTGLGRAVVLASSITAIGIVGSASPTWAAPPDTAAVVAAAPDTNPPETAPPETSPPETSPPETAVPDTTPSSVPDTVPGDDSGADVGKWLVVAVIVILAIVVVGAVIGGLTRRPSRAASTAPRVPPTPTPPVDNAAHQLLATAQWIHDQLTLELLAADPAQAQQRWVVERTRVDNVVIGTQAEASQLNSATWLQLGQFLTQLASAIDTNLQLRSQQPPNPGLVQESVNVITARRNDIQLAINALRPTLR